MSGSSERTGRRPRRRLPAALALTLGLSLPALLAGASPALGAPGDLDPSFGGSGIVRAPAGAQFYAVAAERDGSYAAAGELAGKVFAERFGSDGTAEQRYTGPAGVARAVGLARDGSLVIAGSSGGAMFVQRLGSDLAPQAFGTGASTVSAFAGRGGVANGVAVAPDGTIVAVGAVDAPNTQIAVLRIAPGGTVAGAQTLDPFGLPYATAAAVAIQPDGGIVIAGAEQGSNSYAFFNGIALRLTPSGALDGTFNGSGAYSYHFPGGGYTGFTAVALQPDGNIVLAGIDVGGPNALFVRLHRDGSPDSGFGNQPGQPGVSALSSGSVSTNPGAPVGANAVAIAGAGHVVGAGGYENGGADVEAATWALGPGGAAETAFGGGGTVIGPRPQYEACGLVVGSDGSLVEVGNAVTSFPDNNPCTGGGDGYILREAGFGPPPVAPPPPSPPTVTTGAASSTGSGTELLTGTIADHGQPVGYRFDYGLTAAYGSSTPLATLAADSKTDPVSAAVSGLQPGGLYHYRLVAVRADGSQVAGADATFLTPPTPEGPAASTGPASAISDRAATLTGRARAGGPGSTYAFEYGTGLSYGHATRPLPLPASGAVSARVGGLRARTLYHYRLVLETASGTVLGADRSFRTAPPLLLRVVGRLPLLLVRDLTGRGAALRFACSRACRVVLALRTGTARHPGSLLASGAGTGAGGSRGPATVRLLATPAGRPQLARLGRVPLVLVIDGRSRDGRVRVRSVLVARIG